MFLILGIDILNISIILVALSVRLYLNELIKKGYKPVDEYNRNLVYSTKDEGKNICEVN